MVPLLCIEVKIDLECVFTYIVYEQISAFLDQWVEEKAKNPIPNIYISFSTAVQMN